MLGWEKLCFSAHLSVMIETYYLHYAYIFFVALVYIVPSGYNSLHYT